MNFLDDKYLYSSICLDVMVSANLTKEMLEERLIAFARQHPEIVSLRKGCDPEEGHLTYYFMTSGGGYNSELEDALSALDIELAQKIHFYCDLAAWPATSEEEGFLGNIVWRRAPTQP